MKKFLYFAAFAMMIVLSSVIVSCGDDEVPEEAYGTTIVGTWFTDDQVGIPGNGDYYEYIQFRANGTYTHVKSDVDEPEGYFVQTGKWYVSDGSIALSHDFGIEDVDDIYISYEIVKVTKDKLTLKVMGITFHLSKVSDSVIDSFL